MRVGWSSRRSALAEEKVAPMTVIRSGPAGPPVPDRVNCLKSAAEFLEVVWNGPE